MSSTSPLLGYEQQSLSSLSPLPNPEMPPAIRHPLTRTLSPDLPTHDVLYLFSNFSSYFRNPHEGANGIKSNQDFCDTVRLLDYARVHFQARPAKNVTNPYLQSLASHPKSNAHVLHVKYRFGGQIQDSQNRKSSGKFVLPLNYRDEFGRIRNPIPQPFSVFNDPVVKIDYSMSSSDDPMDLLISFQQRMVSLNPYLVMPSLPTLPKPVYHHPELLSSLMLPP